jgi:hypothetical protein
VARRVSRSDSIWPPAITEPDRAIVPGADTPRDQQRKHPGHERERRHQDGPEPIAVGPEDRLFARHPLSAQRDRVIDLENGVLLHHTEEHQQALASWAALID